MRCIPAVLVYGVRGDQVLVMHRHKEPNLGKWVAPGGKVEHGESPHDTARREMFEETGLKADDLILRGLCTQVFPSPEPQWFQFIFVAPRCSGELRPDLREGELAWVSQERYLRELPIPPADEVFGPRVLAMEQGCFQAKFIHSADLKLVEWVEY